MSVLSFPNVSKSGSNRARHRRRAGRPGKQFFRPAIQHLEDRLMLATDFWTGAAARSGGNDNWSTPGNWSAGVPGPSDTADFTSGQSQAGTSVVDTALSIGALVIDSTWGGTLDVNNALMVNGNFTLASGTIAGTATLTASGSGSQWTGGSLAGMFANAGTLTISGTSTLGLSGTLTNSGTILDTSTAAISANNGATINNQQNGTFNFQADGNLFNANGATGTSFNNAGTLEKTAGTGDSVINILVNNMGTIAGDSGTLQLLGGGSGSGTDTINAGAGSVQLSGSFSGTIAGAGSGAGFVELCSTAQFSPAFTGTGPAGVTLNFTGSVLQWNVNSVAGNVTNAGTLTISGNSILGLSGTLTNTGTIIDAGMETIACANGTTIDNKPGATFDFQADATLANANGATGSSLNNDGTLEKSAGAANSVISIFVNNTGIIAGDSGTLQLLGGGNGSGTDTINAGAGFVQLSGSFSGTLAGAGTGAGFVELCSTALFSPAFTGAGPAGVTLNFTGSVLQWNVNSVAGNVTNAGTLTISGNSTLGLSGTLTNTKMIIDAGTETVACANDTTIDNEPGATFDFQSDATLTNANGATGSSFKNDGILEKSAGSGNSVISIAVNNTGTIAGDSGTLQLLGGGNGSGTDTINAGAGVVQLSGSFSGTLAGAGTGAGFVELCSTAQFSPAFTGAGAAGVTLNFSGSVLQWNVNSVAGNVTNIGTLTITGNSILGLSGTLTNTKTIQSTGTGTIACANGTTIDNAPGATFDFRSDASLFNANGATGSSFNNDGTLEKSGGAGTSNVGFALGGSGTVNVNSGTLAIASGSLEIDGSQVLVVAPSATLTLGGNLAGSTQNGDQFAPDGTVVLNGSGTSAAPQFLEVMSGDQGDVAAGFANNFAYGTLALTHNDYVRLVDNSSNSSATGPDALYVNSAVVPVGATLDLNGLHVYARQTQNAGSIVGGTVGQLAAGGPLQLNTPAPGLISQSGQVDTWTFYGNAGQTVAIVVDTGSQGTLNPLQPALNFAQVQVLDPGGTVVASGSNTQGGADVALTGIALASNGTYSIHVQAPASHSGSTGNYLISEWDGTVRNTSLNVDETVNGQLSSPYSTDQWNFSAIAAEQVQFNLVNSSSTALTFDLTGPNGVTVFAGRTTGSGLLALPAAGQYTLKVHLTADLPGAYAFNLAVSAQANLAPGTPYQDALTGSGQAQLFTVTLAGPAALSIVVTDPNAGDQNEVYVSAGQAPTRDTFQYSSSGEVADPTVAFAAQAGTYNILVYNNLVTAPGSHYTIEVQAPPFAWTGFTPGQTGSAQIATVFATGVFPLEYQSPNAYQIQFVSSVGFVFPSTPIYLGPTELSLGSGSSRAQNGTRTLSATIPANTVPAGTYSVRITDSQGNSQSMKSALTVTGGGAGVLHTNIYAPSPVGLDLPATLYVTYSNVGTAPMAAPVLALSGAINDQPGAFLSLDPAQAGLGYTRNTTPAGFSLSVQFLASGLVPGVLEPGESVTVPVYEGGFLDSEWDFPPPITYTVGELDTTNTATIDWSSLEASMRPSTINQTAWSAIFPVLTANLGSTWGQYLQTLDNDAVYLAGVGEPTTDLNQLLSFEIEKANAAYTAQTLGSVVADDLPAPGMDLTFEQSFQQSISGRNTEGIVGFGWTTNWDISASAMPNGDVVIDSDGVSQYFSLQPDGSFAPPRGEERTTLTAGGGTYQVVDPDGTSYQFNANGTLDYVEDTHGNRITAGYNAQGQLDTLTHSNGEFFDLAYNTQGLLATLTDSTGETEAYAYNSAGELVSFTDEYGTTAYSYLTGQSAAQNNALSEIAFADNTHAFFGYDSQGRLIDQHRDNGHDDETWAYSSPGGYVTTDADGNQSTIYFNLYGTIAETIDPLGNVTRYGYDSNQNLTTAIAPGGATYTYTYDANSNLTSETDPLGLTTTFTYDGNNNLTSTTDAKGDTTRYAYDSQNDVLSITYANGTEQRANYNPLGEAIQYLNASGQSIGTAYNTQGLVTKETFADGTSYSYMYDASGDLTSATDAQGDVTTFVYANPSNPYLLTEVEYPDGTFLKFTYNDVGQRTRSVDQTGFTVNYAYDSSSRLSALTDGDGNRIVLYTYDPAGNLIQEDMGNGTRTVYTYARDGDLQSITNYASVNGPVNSFDDYTYDALGNVLTDTSQDGEWSYTYDADSQLAQAIFTPNDIDPDGLAAQDLQYVYDAAGNRESETENGVTTTYVVNNVNEYTSSTTSGVTTRYQYNADGNLVAQSDPSGTTSYTLNGLNELTTVNGPGVSASYAYDPFGNKISQTVQGVTTHFQIDPAGLGNAVATSNGAGALTAHYTYGLGLVSQISPTGTAAYYDFNLLGSTIGITGLNGSYVNKYSYLAFGQTTSIAAALSNPFTYIGDAGVQDDGIGLFAMGARSYDASTGQFTSRDPLGLSGGSANLLTYVGNNPVSDVDPLGLQSQPASDPRSGLEKALNYFGIGENAETNYSKKVGLYDPDSTDTQQEADANQAIQQIKEDAPKQANGLFVKFYNSLQPEVPLPRLKPGDPSLVEKGQRFVAGKLIGGQTRPLQLNFKADQDPQPPPGILRRIIAYFVQKKDPNSMIGPSGYGPDNFVLSGSLLPYQVLFENDPTATGAAQRVGISDPLDPNLDWTTLQLSAVGVGSTYITIPAGLQHYATTVNTTENGQAVEVKISLNFNPATGVLSSAFQWIDPTTGLPPASPLIGLEPEDGSGRGIGFVSFTINPKAGLVTGTQIRNIAGVSFNFSPNIFTDQVSDEDPTLGIDPAKQALITIDATPPTSAVSSLPTVTTSTSFTVAWSGTDSAGPGIASYDVLVSEDGGPYAVFETDTNLTSATFTGAFGHTYKFYSVATDNLGLVQPTPTSAQATTSLAGPPTSSVSALPAVTSTTSFTVSWSGTPGPGATSIASYEIFVSTDGGPFTPFLSMTTQTSATFTGQSGHSYGFSSVATNNLGLVQVAPTTAQATTTVSNPPPPPPVPPMIIGEKAIFQRKTNKKGKPTGKAVLTGFSLTFSEPLNPATATNRLEYQLANVTTKKVKKKTTTILKPITNFTVSYNASSETVNLTLIGTQAFSTGGKLTVVGTPPNGVSGASGAPLAGTTVFAISKKGNAITPSK
jgi:RHS repeat-associated protein